MACQVIWDLSRDVSVDFYHKDKNLAADWWMKSLIDFESYSTQRTVTQRLYKATGVDLGKVTHYRTYAVQKGGFNGLTPAEMKTLSRRV